MRLFFTLRNSLLAFVLSMSPALAAGTINSLPAITASPGTFPLPDPGCTSTATSNYWITQGTGANTDFRIDPLRAGYIFQGTVAPTCPFKYQLWWNTSGSLATLQAYSGSAWVTISDFDFTNGLWVPQLGGGTIPTVASATTTDLCSAGTTPQAIVNVSGAVTITSFGSNCPKGTMKVVNWTGSPPPQVTYNASTLILPGAANITPHINDVWMLAYLGSGAWQLYFEQPAASFTGVISFNGRTGVVVPAANDYSFSQISGSATNAQLPTLAPVGTATKVSAALASANISVTVQADGVVVGTALGGVTYTLGGLSTTFNGGVVGAGGMDTGTLPSNGNVCIYAIYSPTGPASNVLGVNCATSSGTIYSGSNAPTGYTASAFLGFFPTNGTPQMTAGNIQRPSDRGCAPNVQVLTSGSSATYTTPTCNGILPLALDIEIIGGAGGGSGGNASNGGNGVATTFGSLTANGGTAATSGGTATGGDLNLTGGCGGGGTYNNALNSAAIGGIGASTPFGGAGLPVYDGVGGGGVANTGAGGAGGGVDGNGGFLGGGGGGCAGGYLRKTFTAPIASTYTYTVGTGGAGGAGGASGKAGGAGGSGVIIAKAVWH